MQLCHSTGIQRVVSFDNSQLSFIVSVFKHSTLSQQIHRSLVNMISYRKVHEALTWRMLPSDTA